MAVGCVFCLGALAASGCGGGSAKPHGKVVMNGEPYKPVAGQLLQISFIGDGTPSISTVAQVNPDGTFTVPGPTDNGIPPGKYHITASTMASGGPGGTAGGTTNVAAPSGGDQFQGKYRDASKTPLTVDITSANSDIIIDLGKGTVSKGP
jgi:hypothetical protein